MNSVSRAYYPLISVLLPTWNNRDDTLEFLESLACQTYPKSAIEVIITDNGSTDGSQEAIRSWYAARSAVISWHRLELIELPKNQGIAVGYNVAYGHSSPESFAVLRAESDVLLAPDLIAVLVKALLELPDAGVVGARGVLHDAPERIDHAARYMNWWTGLPIDIDPDTRADCDCVFGGTFIVRRSCIEQMGTFFKSDRFFASELEFCTRVKRLGYRVLCDPCAVAYHKVARSTSNLDRSKFAYVEYRERVLFHLAYNRFPQKAVFLAFTLALCLKQALLGNGMYLRGFLDGLTMGYLHRPVRLPNRSPDTHISLAEWIVQARSNL